MTRQDLALSLRDCADSNCADCRFGTDGNGPCRRLLLAYAADCIDGDIPLEEGEEKTDDTPVQSDDMVCHPNHYCKGGIECIEAIEASMPPEEFKGYLKGNALKYIWRYEDKGGAQDLQKAGVYLGWLYEEVTEDGT